MDKNFVNAFNHLDELTPDSGLEGHIFDNIERIRARRLRRKIIFIRAMLATSILSLSGSVIVYGTAFANSEFLNMLKLLFSDLSIVLQNGSQYAYSLLETFPAVMAAAFLAPLCLLFWSLGSYLDLNSKKTKTAVRI